MPDVFTGCILYDALVRFGKDFEIVPNLAKSWEISPDGLTYTFHLEKADLSRRQAGHLGGRQVHADARSAAKYGPKFNAPGSFIQTIETPDPLTAIIKLSKPFGPFLFSLACEQNAPILPAHVFRGSDVLKNPASLVEAGRQRPVHAAGVGARRPPDASSRTRTTGRKGQPYLDRIVVKIMPDASARVLALRAGEVDFIDEYYFPLSAHAAVREATRTSSLQDVSYPSGDLIILNTKKPHLDNAKVRQALLIAIDREFLHDAVFYGIGGVPQSAIDTRIAWAYNPAVDYRRCTRTTRSARPRCSTRPASSPAPTARASRCGCSFDAGRAGIHRPGAGAAALLAGGRHQGRARRRRTSGGPEAGLHATTTSTSRCRTTRPRAIRRSASRASTSPSSIKQGTTFNNASRYSNPEVDELFDARPQRR